MHWSPSCFPDFSSSSADVVAKNNTWIRKCSHTASARTMSPSHDSTGLHTYCRRITFIHKYSDRRQTVTQFYRAENPTGWSGSLHARLYTSTYGCKSTDSHPITCIYLFVRLSSVSAIVPATLTRETTLKDLDGRLTKRQRFAVLSSSRLRARHCIPISRLVPEDVLWGSFGSSDSSVSDSSPNDCTIMEVATRKIHHWHPASNLETAYEKYCSFGGGGRWTIFGIRQLRYQRNQECGARPIYTMHVHPDNRWRRSTERFGLASFLQILFQPPELGARAQKPG